MSALVPFETLSNVANIDRINPIIWKGKKWEGLYPL